MKKMKQYQNKQKNIGETFFSLNNNGIIKSILFKGLNEGA